MKELPVNDLLTVDQAIAILDAVPVHPRVVQLPLMNAIDLRLAEDIFADRDYPPFDKAVMDGFAIRSGGGPQFAVIETVAAGQMARQSIGVGQAMAIMTGAPIPDGADAVVPIEWTTLLEDQVRINRPVKAGNAIARHGSDSPKDRLLLARGMQLGPAQVAVAASVGKSIVQVYRAPIVALLTTGDELIDIDRQPIGSQIRNSNGPMMAALLRQMGGTVQDLGTVRDDRNLIRQAIQAGLQTDALFITGGMSMGEHDYVPGLLRELGLDLKISKLRIKPGKPFVFAVGPDSQMAFGLPGNPVSAFVCTVRLASRVLARLAGALPQSPITQAILSTDLPANGPREFYLPGQLAKGRIRPLSSNGSADIFTLAGANALIVRPENAPAAAAGMPISIIQLQNL